MTMQPSCLRVCLLALAGLSNLATGQVPTILGPGLDPSQLRVTTFATGLNYPVGMSELSDGSVLVAVSNGSSFFGSTSGSLVRLADTNGDGVADVQQTLVNNVPGGKLSSLKRAGDLVAVTGQGSGVPISLYRLGATPSSTPSFLGQLQLTYPSGGWLHPHSALLFRETPGVPDAYELYFQLGSDTNNQLTTRTVTLGGTLGISATLVGDALHRINLVDGPSGLTAVSQSVIATGLRNATGLAFHPVTGDLYIGDNGIDGLVDANEPTSPDELNVIPLANLGGSPENFGFPSTYQQYRTGVNIGSTGVAPLLNYQPIPMPNGAEAEGVNEIAFSPPLFPAPLNNGVFAGFHGKFGLGGLSNEENAVGFYDLDSGAYFHTIANTEAAIGHPDGLLTTRDTLYLSDISPGGGFGASNANSGKVYAIRSLIKPGDYNRDGLIDAADYTVWRDTQGSSGLGLVADGNGDYQVSTSDRGVWQRAYGDGASSASTVPEPTAVALLLIAGAFLRGGMPRTRQKGFRAPRR